MGPVAYVADAVIVRIADALGLGAETAFRLVRLFGVLQLAALVVVLGALMARVVSTSPASLAALTIIALNPMLLTMSASVQNDSLALLLGAIVLILALALARRSSSTRRRALHRRSRGRGGVDQAHGLGRRRRASPVGSCGSTGAGRSHLLLRFSVRTLAVCGWWFVRNVVLYGDPTAASAVERTGVSFDRYRLAQPW